MTHKKKDCLERPRKVGAKFNNANIAADEFVQPELSRDFDGKRDRWAGYDPAQHKEVVERFAQIEEAKRQLRSEKLNAQAQAQVNFLCILLFYFFGLSRCTKFVLNIGIFLGFVGINK